MAENRLNALCWSILDLLRQHPERYGIHHLVVDLESETAFPRLDADPQLHLFKKNFLVMNALFELQAWLFSEGCYLKIGTLDIQLQPSIAAKQQELVLGAQENLRSYYLDWSHYHSTSRRDVEALLQQFFAGHCPESRRVEALKVLELEAGASPSEVRQQYRRLVARHHPDRGGEPQRFIAIRSAWERLRGSH